MTTVILNGLGPNINADRLKEAELLLGWSDALETRRISLEEYARENDEEPPILGG